jgi:hypothetical protein
VADYTSGHDTGRAVYMAPGGVTAGFGDNTALGGTNVSNSILGGAVGGATLKAGDRMLVENGTLTQRSERGGVE